MHAYGASFGSDESVVNPDAPFADFLNLSEGMGYDNDGCSLPFDFLKTVETFFLECRISDSKDFVYEKNVRVHIDCYGKSEPHVHSRRIGPYRIVDEFLELRKCYDVIHLFVNLFFGQTENGCVGIDVFPSAHVGVESCAELNQS